jgi:hypothetical protein
MILTVKTYENDKCYVLFLKISKERQHNRKTLKTNGRTKFTIFPQNICIKKFTHFRENFCFRDNFVRYRKEKARECAQTIIDFRKNIEKFRKDLRKRRNLRSLLSFYKNVPVRHAAVRRKTDRKQCQMSLSQKIDL